MSDQTKKGIPKVGGQLSDNLYSWLNQVMPVLWEAERYCELSCGHIERVAFSTRCSGSIVDISLPPIEEADPQCGG
jgi:hypothetical protein